MANKSKSQMILEIEEDLRELISYDEWSAHEYGEEKVDLYDTAMNLYNAGYRKVKKTGDAKNGN
jgi:hypothetical protein